MSGTGPIDGLKWKRAICGICPAGCWVEIAGGEKIEDIRPDPSHSLGTICRRGQHSADIVYSEHRLKYPLKRKGPKGSFEFERISWDEAYDTICAKLNQFKQESGPETVSIYTGRGAFELSLCDMFQPKGVAVSSASSVLFPFGSPNTMGVGALCYVSYAMIAPHVTFGRMLVNMFTDIEHAETIIVWGANPATDSPPMDMIRLEAAAKRGAKIIVIDPRHTETAYRCGAEWLAIRPGTDGALALSLIQVMIEEELYDQDFATSWCHGFDELGRYVQHFRPEVVETITGIAAATIRDLARRICQASGCAPVMYTGLEYSNSGIQAIRAVLTVWALAGQLDVPGGLGLAMLNTHFPISRACNIENPNLDRAVSRDKFPIYSLYRGESHASGLIDSVVKSDPYRIRGLIIHGASLLTSWPQTQVWRETLSKLEFLVCIDRQLTADAAYADILLPAATMFEIDSYMVYGPIFRLREKVIEPVGEARNDYLIMAELARRLGYGERYPQSEEEMIRFALQGSGYSLEDVKAAGGWVKIPTPMMEYKKWQKGGLRPDRKPGFDTPTGKFEILSTLLSDYGYEPLPKYTEPKEGPLASPEAARSFPLVFNSGSRLHTDFRSQHHGIGPLVREASEPFVELNIDDAKDRRIQDGDQVEVRTARGAVRFRARVTDDIVKGAVECNMGGGTPVGPKAWRDSNVNELTDMGNYDEISGFPVYKSLLCEVVKTEAGSSTNHLSRSRPPSVVAADSGAASLKRRIYLDNNATTKMSDAVRAAMSPYFDSLFGNPSSIHGSARESVEAIDRARRQVANLIHAKPRRIIFTSGGSEADNLALKGVALTGKNKGKHIITSSIEHPAILKTCKFLEEFGYRVTYLPVDSEGSVDPARLASAITDETILVSIMMANNEVGTIQPIRELCSIAHERGVLFHTDAVQAVGKIKVDVEDLNVDLLSLSGHKFHGPKGMGALYVNKAVSLEPLIHGGKQEGGFRGGTENVPAIVGIGKAAELVLEQWSASDHMRKLRDKLECAIMTLIPGAKLNGHRQLRLTNTLNLTLPELRGESLVIALDQHGISLSSGSACKSGSPDPTHVLLAMQRSREEAHCAVRFSLSHETTEQDIENTMAALRTVLKEMETTIRFLPCK
ncbi:MAG TPA: aminotransferase V [Bdellovibrionales bacterium]|nr:aminotransferase V [Bdellovibrionales bacterium]